MISMAELKEMDEVTFARNWLPYNIYQLLDSIVDADLDGLTVETLFEHIKPRLKECIYWHLFPKEIAEQVMVKVSAMGEWTLDGFQEDLIEDQQMYIEHCRQLGFKPTRDLEQGYIYSVASSYLLNLKLKD